MKYAKKLCEKDKCDLSSQISTGGALSGTPEEENQTAR